MAIEHPSRDSLVKTGWLFQIAISPESPTDSLKDAVNSWNYWMEFDFSGIEWQAIKNSSKDILILVLISILNLMIYVPSLAFSLDIPYNMSHEFLGHGFSNIVAGLTGTVPNLLVSLQVATQVALQVVLIYTHRYTLIHYFSVVHKVAALKQSLSLCSRSEFF